jgi:hypothetical protein
MESPFFAGQGNRFSLEAIYGAPFSLTPFENALPKSFNAILLPRKQSDIFQHITGISSEKAGYK